LNLDIDILRKTVETNAFGPFLISQKLIPLMKKNNFGRIVNVSSVYGQLCTMEGDFSSAYKISKATLNAVTRVLAYNKETKGILINSVCPGWVRTDMGNKGGETADLSVEEGVETIIWLTELPDDGPTGKFFQNKKEMDW